MPETLLHFELRQLLWQLLSLHFDRVGTAGSDQFVYWDPTSPKQNVAPDVYFALGQQPRPITSWKTWERGVPDLAIEIVSDSDSSRRAKEKSVARYAELGVRELIRFDRLGPRPTLEAWDIEDHVATPRAIDERLTTPCKTLGCHVVARELAPLGLVLRFARDEDGSDLYLTERELRARSEGQLSRAEEERQRAEAERQRVETERQRAESERQRAEEARIAAEAKVAELTALLAAARRGEETKG